jgi:hypothetical protein
MNERERSFKVSHNLARPFSRELWNFTSRRGIDSKGAGESEKSIHRRKCCFIVPSKRKNSGD